MLLGVISELLEDCIMHAVLALIVEMNTNYLRFTERYSEIGDRIELRAGGQRFAEIVTWAFW